MIGAGAPAAAARVRSVPVILFAAAVAAVVAIVSAGGGWRLASLEQPFLAAALMGSFVVYLSAERPRRERLVAVALSALLAAAVLLAGARRGGDIARTVLHAQAAFGAASLAVLAIATMRAPPDARAAPLVALANAGLVPAFVLLSGAALSVTGRAHQQVLDGLVYAADGALGGQASFALGRWLRAYPALGALAATFYWELPLVLASICAAERQARRPGPDLTVSFVMAGALGSLAYNLFPVVGPLFVFGDAFPGVPPTAAGALAGIGAVSPAIPRNGMPSLHFAWALLAWWHARDLERSIRRLGAANVVLTVLATLGMGWHYAMDLVVALPFAATVVALSRAAYARPPSRERCAAAAAAGLAVTAASLALLRAGLAAHAAVAWSLVAVGAAAALAVERLTRLPAPAWAAASAVAPLPTAPPLTRSS